MKEEKEAGPWAWFEQDTFAIRIDASFDSSKGVIAEVSIDEGVEWSGWMWLHGKKQHFRGPTADDVMGRIDAVLQTIGWTLRPRQPHPDFAKEGPRPLKKPVTAERIVDALMKDPRLAMDVRELLSARFAGR